MAALSGNGSRHSSINTVTQNHWKAAAGIYENQNRLQINSTLNEPLQREHDRLEYGLRSHQIREITTHNSHISTFNYAVLKLASLKIINKTYDFALRAKQFIKLIQMAYEELQKLQGA